MESVILHITSFPGKLQLGTRKYQFNNNDQKTSCIYFLYKWVTCMKKFLCIIYALLLFSGFNHIFAQNVIRPDIALPAGMNVDSYTGNLFYQREDLNIPGRGPELMIRFSYNTSNNEDDWGFGFGWTLSMCRKYMTGPSQFILIREDGRKDTFTFSGGAYHPSAGIFDTLIQYQPDKFSLTDTKGTIYYFDDSSSKKLSKIHDRNGNEMLISYNSQQLPDTITDASGRYIILNWSNNHLSKITDPNTSPKRMVIYQYNSSGMLTSVTDPLGNTTSYSYDSRRT